VPADAVFQGSRLAYLEDCQFNLGGTERLHQKKDVPVVVANAIVSFSFGMETLSLE